MNEIWKPIEKLNGRYEISNKGRIRGVWSGKILKQFKSNAGYLNVRVHGGHNKNVTVYIHQMVAQTFIPNPENKSVVNHKDGIKTNNSADNLEWVTYQENTLHARDMGMIGGSKHPRSKLSEDDIAEIRKNYKHRSKEYGLTPMSKKYGVTKSAIYSVVNGKTWKHFEEG